MPSARKGLGAVHRKLNGLGHHSLNPHANPQNFKELKRLNGLSSQMGWLPPSPDGIAMCQESGVYSHRAGRTATVMKDTMIGVDLAKNVFQLHAASMTGQLRFSRKLSREKFRSFMAGQPPAVVVMEACGSAHYWAREMVRLGHEVKLIAAQYVRPFVKRQKNDAADAEAIVIAAQRPEMRFVEPKTAEQQSRAILFRARERLVRQRTELINALRACLYEYGHIIPQGAHQIKRVAEILDTPNSDLPALMREECAELLEQIAEQTVRINARTTKIKALAVEADTARRLQTIPGVGPLTALAVEAFAPPMENFKCGRDFAAWLGLVPRGPSRYPQAADYRRDVAAEPAGAEIDPGDIMAGTHRSAKAQNAGGDRLSQQDGADDLGADDEKRGLSSSGAGGSGGMTNMQPTQPDVG
ncbi:hypothetical protein E4T56_gene18707 [Termitomyces sp. T112]|nr:hypothetical protein E4T56_gene18707 [Termitomyces sp. T112]